MGDRPFVRVNFDLPVAEHERLKRLRWGMPTHVLRALVKCANDLYDKGGDSSMADLAGDHYVLLPRMDSNNEPPKPSGYGVSKADAERPTSTG